MRLGRHMPTHSNAAKAAQIACQLGCTSIQIFASNPTGWRPSTGNPASCAAFVQAAKDNGLEPVVIHAPYLINLASPDEVIWEKSIALLRWTLQRGELLGAAYVVFHTGSHRGSGVDAGLARIAEAIALILPETPPEVMLLLENDVGAGNSLGHSFEQIGMVLHVLPQYEDRLGVCLDTAHLWGAGHDISNAASVRQLLQHFDDVIGLKRLKVMCTPGLVRVLSAKRACELYSVILASTMLRFYWKRLSKPMNKIKRTGNLISSNWRKQRS
jgi:deoxyribonuclease-4